MAIRHFTAAIGLIVLTARLSFAEEASTAPKLIPQPKSVSVVTGSLQLSAKSRVIAADHTLQPLAKILAGEIEQITGLAMEAGDDKGVAGDVLLSLDSSLKGEAYRLDVTDQAIVRGVNYNAVAAGTATLLQAIHSSKDAVTIPKISVTDEPTYPFRGALIDLARKYHSPESVKQVIELCRFYKIRFLHVHISDDQLFMFPSAKFPQVGKGNQEFARFEPGSKAHIEPYKREELLELESYAAERGVHIVPEMDLPGHSGRLVGDAPEVFSFPGNGSTVNIASPKTLEAVAVLLNEVMDIFKSTPYVHLGADEVGLGGLENTPEYKATQEKFGNIASPHDLYCKFIVDLCGIVAKRGKKPIVWEEAWNAGGAYSLPKDVLVMVWSQGRNPNEIVKHGYDVVNATWTPLYIVRDNKKSLEFLFHWNPTQFGREGSNEFTPLDDPTKLQGAQLCSWENSEAIEIQSLRDRLALVAERTWNRQVAGDFAEFKSRFASTDGILDKLVNPLAMTVQASSGDFTRDENTFEGPLTVALTPNQPAAGLSIKYTLDNSLPNANWKTYAGPLKVEDTAHLRAGLFDGQNKQHGSLVGSWFRRVVGVKPNLATHKPVTVGPSPDRNDAWSAKVAVDGQADNVNAHWASEGPAPQWLMIDLEQIYPIDSINVITYYDGGRYYQFTVETSVDGKTWQKVVDYADNKIPATAAGHPAKFDKTEARYVRINMLRNSANPFAHIVEVIVNRAEQ